MGDVVHVARAENLKDRLDLTERLELLEAERKTNTSELKVLKRELETKRLEMEVVLTRMEMGIEKKKIELENTNLKLELEELALKKLLKFEKYYARTVQKLSPNKRVACRSVAGTEQPETSVSAPRQAIAHLTPSILHPQLHEPLEKVNPRKRTADATVDKRKRPRHGSSRITHDNNADHASKGETVYRSKASLELLPDVLVLIIADYVGEIDDTQLRVTCARFRRDVLKHITTRRALFTKLHKQAQTSFSDRIVCPANIVNALKKVCSLCQTTFRGRFDANGVYAHIDCIRRGPVTIVCGKQCKLFKWLLEKKYRIAYFNYSKRSLGLWKYHYNLIRKELSLEFLIDEQKAGNLSEWTLEYYAEQKAIQKAKTLENKERRERKRLLGRY